MPPTVHAALAAALLVTAQALSAHPALVTSEPKSDAVAAAPKQLRLQFNEPVEVAFTRVQLIDAAGKPVPGEAVHADPGDANAVALALPALAAGPYTVHWSAAGRDGHRVKGTYGFTVK